MKLLPGMTANITVTIAEIKDVLKVPSAALRFNPPQEYLAQLESALPDSLKKKREQWKQRQGQGMGSGEGMGRDRNSHGPGGEGQRGTVWVTDTGKLKPMRVTQVEGKITEGMEVVTGQTSQSAAKTQTPQQNPFAPQMPGGRR
jgi:HlyD family secretion protein